MNKARTEAFSDGVIAIIITIMVLELKVPHDVSLHAVFQLAPVFFSYVLSFIYVGIYWSNHHHLFHAVHKVNGSILWANLHLLFWLSLIPFVTGWMGENHFSALPVALYGVVLLCAAIAYLLLSRRLISHHGDDSVLAKVIGSDIKGKVSLIFYIMGIGLSAVSVWLACACYVAVALMWLIPDQRIEKILSST
jgi:uncharacterized membrane protein